MNHRCDGLYDCDHFTDESNCTSYCYGEALKCMHEDKCIQKSWRCDGDWDCEDGSDEIPTSCVNTDLGRPTSVPVAETAFSQNCLPGRYQCRSGTCIDDSLVCDGKEDCSDSSDEHPVQCRNACNKKICPHNCKPSPRGPICKCQTGFELHEKDGILTCQDVNECLEVNACSQKCINQKGSHNCQCFKGFDFKRRSKSEDPSRCVVEGASEELDHLLIIDDLLIKLKDTYHQIKVPSSEGSNGHILGAFYNPLGMSIVITQIRSPELKIVQLHNDGAIRESGIEHVQIPDNFRPTHCVSDYVGKNTYLANHEKLKICGHLRNKDFSCKTIVDLHKSEAIVDLTIDPINDVLFVASTELSTGWALHGILRMLALDGTIIKDIKFELLYHHEIWSIACDGISKRIYTSQKEGKDQLITLGSWTTKG